MTFILEFPFLCGSIYFSLFDDFLDLIYVIFGYIEFLIKFVGGYCENFVFYEDFFLFFSWCCSFFLLFYCTF